MDAAIAVYLALSLTFRLRCLGYEWALLHPAEKGHMVSQEVMYVDIVNPLGLCMGDRLPEL